MAERDEQTETETESKESGKRLLRGTGLYLAQTVLAALIGLAALPLYTLFLTPDDFGIIGYATVVAAVVKIALTLGLDAAVSRLYHDYRDDLVSQRVLLGTITVTLIVTIGGGGCLIALFGAPLYDWSLPDAQVAFHPYLELAIFGIVAEQARVVPLTLLKTQERAGAFVALSAPMDIGRVVARLVFVGWLDMGAYGWLLSSLLFDAALALPFAFWLVRHTRLVFSFAMLRRALRFSGPLVPHMMAHWSLHLADRVILERLVPMTSLGLYGFGYQVARGWNDVNMAVGDAWAPLYYRLAATGAAGRSELARLQEKVLSILALGSLAFALFSREVVELLSAPAYHASAPIVTLVLGAYALHGLYVIFVSGIYHRKQTRLLPVFTIVAAVLNVVGNFVLVPWIGIAGAAWSTLFGYGLLAGAVVVHAQTIHPLPLRSVQGFVFSLVLFGAAWSVSFLDASLGVRVAAKLGALGAFVAWLLFVGALPTVREVRDIFARVRKTSS